MNPKKIIVHDETEKIADEKETQVKKKKRKVSKPPEEPEEEQEELLDSGTRLPKMRW